MTRNPLANFDLNSKAVRALAVFACTVAVLAAVLAWRSRPMVTPLEPLGPAPAATTPAPASAIVVVAVSGRVHRPGLVRLPAGSRVADAIAAAGGALPETDLSMVNLARKLNDGELIVVGLAASAAAAGGVEGNGGQPGLVNVNTATLEQLQALPGIGPVLAGRIIDYREEHGGFTSVAQLRQVSGIGEERYQELKDLVTL